MIVYHTTEKNNITTILKEGLKISVFDKKIYFADSLQNAYTWQKILRQDYGIKEKLVILKVNLPKKELKINYITRETNDIIELIYNKNILPYKIKVLK